MLYGAGFGLSISQLANLVLSDIPFNKAGVASGATNTIRQIGATMGIAIIGAVMFGTFAAAAVPMVEESSAFADFGARVEANSAISPAARTLGTQIAGFGDTVKDTIIESIENNEGFDASGDPFELVLANVPPLGRTALRAQGIDLDDETMVRQLRTDLDADLTILVADIQRPVGLGFAEAARTTITLAGVFVLAGALSSLMLPRNTRKPVGEGEQVAAMAH
jgi:hypothetical protein